MTDPQRAAEAMYANDDAAHTLGIDLTHVALGTATMAMTVRADLTNGHDVCHGGFLFTLADTAMAYASNSAGIQAFATHADIDFLNPARAGSHLTATATEQALRGKAGIYDVTITDDDGTTIALFRGRTLRTGTPIVPVVDEDVEGPTP